MEKKNKTIVLVIVVVIILAFSVWLASKSPSETEEGRTNPNSDISTEQGSVPNPDAVNLADDPALIPVEIDVPADLDWREAVKAPSFRVEFMTNDEKQKMGIAAEKKVQILSRDENSGIILAYKVINNDDEIVTGQ